MRKLGRGRRRGFEWVDARKGLGGEDEEQGVRLECLALLSSGHLFCDR